MKSAPIACCLVILWGFTAKADVTVTFSESASGVQLEAVGSLDMTGLSARNVSGLSILALQGRDSRVLSTTDISREFQLPTFSEMTQFGSAPGTVTNTSASQPGFNLGYVDNSGGSIDVVYMPNGYVSNQLIDLDHTYLGFDLDDFGLAEGDFWGVVFPIYDGAGTATGATQSMTFRTIAIPEPGGWFVLLASGFATTILRRKR